MDFIHNVSCTIIEWHIEMLSFDLMGMPAYILIQCDTFICMNLSESQETNIAARKFLI